jgi:hypothetical protein
MNEHWYTSHVCSFSTRLIIPFQSDELVLCHICYVPGLSLEVQFWNDQPFSYRALPPELTYLVQVVRGVPGTEHVLVRVRKKPLAA